MIDAAQTSVELEQLKAILERLPDGVVSVTDEGDVVHANAAARRLFHPARLRAGVALPSVWNEVSLAPFVDRLFRRGTATITEEITSSNGRVYSVVGIGAGKASSAVMMVEDVTARARHAQAQREFVANAAHELLTPLTGIVGAAHVLESGAKVVPETRDRFIAHIARECDRLARIARALLILARARSGEEPPRLELVELGPLILDAVRAANAEGDVDVRCDPSLRVLVDRDLAEQAFVNLVANARRHSGDDAVTIEAREMPERMVVIEVVDHGAGMDADQVDRLRRRFATGAGRDSHGFGLGLSIAAQTLETIGGSLSFDSIPGEGTRAIVELPSARIGT